MPASASRFHRPSVLVDAKLARTTQFLPAAIATGVALVGMDGERAGHRTIKEAADEGS